MVVQVSDFDCFFFIFFMVLVVYVMIVLGIMFVLELFWFLVQIMEIMLFQFEDEQVLDEVDFLVQINQQGSGIEEQVQEMIML